MSQDPEKQTTDNCETGQESLNHTSSSTCKAKIRLLRTEAGKDGHKFKKVLDDLIKKVDSEEVQPDEIIGILLTLCEKLQYIQQVKDYYHDQSKHNRSDLGTEADRVRVPIWIDDKLDGSWNRSLHEAVQAINKAAPGLSLLITDKNGAMVHVLAIDEEEAYTEGNILMRSIPQNSHFITKICLGKWKDDIKKEIIIHELLHALGFHHEHQHSDAPFYEYHLDSGKKLTINKNWLGFIHFDSSSTTLHPCEKKTCEHSEDPVCTWLLKAYPTQKNIELDELDMVGLNLAFPPCVDKTGDNVGYRPSLGKNGMYYCKREVMSGPTYPKAGEKYTRLCGPDEGPNCPACRTIKSPKVEMILNGGRWQGMTGRVYCGRPFTEPAQIYITHDGMCGANNGPACPECYDILNKEI